MTTPQVVFFGVLFFAGGWFGGLFGYVFLSDRRPRRKADRHPHRHRHRSTS